MVLRGQPCGFHKCMKLVERALRGHFSYLSAMIHHGELLWETKRGTCIG